MGALRAGELPPITTSWRSMEYGSIFSYNMSLAIDGFGFTYLGDNNIWQRLWYPENTYS